MSAKILISDKFAPEGVAILEAADGMEVINKPGLSADELNELLPTIDGLAIRSGTQVTAAAIAASRGSLKAVARAGVGVDNVDLHAASAAEVVVMNTPHGNNITTAEHAVALILASSRNIVPAATSMAAGRWEKKRLSGRQLHGRKAGVIGFGNIGKLVVARLAAFGMDVMVADPMHDAEAITAGGGRKVELGELYAEADVISMHVPLLPATKRMINADTLALMKDDAFLVCAARGGVIDEVALAAALDAGKLSGVALDVFEQEPPPADHPLLAHPKVICTPHLGASTREAQLQVSIDAAHQLIDFFQKGEVRNQVN